MDYLPEMVFGDAIRKQIVLSFGGYNHNQGIRDGDCYDQRNMSSESYPVLTPRRARHLVRKLTKPNGIYEQDGLYLVDGTTFYAGDVAKGTVTDCQKRFASLGVYIIILPDKAYYNRLTDEFGSLEATRTESVMIQDGTFAGEPAKGNTVYKSGYDWSSVFQVGDAVEVKGCVIHTGNNKTAIIREIDGGYLRFYENTFTIGESGDAETITLSRSVPDLDFACENENRLWGCKGNTIYACKLGDPFNWNVFDGVSTDSYAVNVGSPGSFTACTSFLGYPCFFKESNVYKVYGSKPSDFQVMGSATLGVASGSGKSIAVAGETMFYLSRAGVTAYSGGFPQNVSTPFGGVAYKNATAGSDGTKLYISMQDYTGMWNLFCFDSLKKLWSKEDDLQVLGFAYYNGLYLLDSNGNLWLSGDAAEIPSGATNETSVDSVVEFGTFDTADPNKKGVSKIQIRAELDSDASLEILIQFDSCGDWETVRVLQCTRKRSFYVPIVPRRCDHFQIKLSGTGRWALFSMVAERYSGSEI